MLTSISLSSFPLGDIGENSSWMTKIIAAMTESFVRKEVTLFPRIKCCSKAHNQSPSGVVRLT